MEKDSNITALRWVFLPNIFGVCPNVLRRGDDEFFQYAGGVFLLGRTHTFLTARNTVLSPHGVSSPMWGGSVFGSILPFKRRLRAGIGVRGAPAVGRGLTARIRLEGGGY